MNKSMLSPLLTAACLGDVDLMRLLLDMRADVNRCYEGKPVSPLGLVKGTTPLHLAVAIAEDEATIELLLRRGAQLDARAGPSGATALLTAAARGASRGIRALARACEKVRQPFRPDIGLKRGNASPLSLAVRTGSHDAVRALLDLGANLRHVDDYGSTVWTDSCDNWHVDLLTLELLRTRFGAESGAAINAGRLDPRSIRRRALDAACEALDRVGLNRTKMVRAFAYTGGFTPLHCAASQGNLGVVRWLLRHGARASLATRSTSGFTPLDIARLHGPFPAVMAELQQAVFAQDSQARTWSLTRAWHSHGASVERSFSSSKKRREKTRTQDSRAGRGAPPKKQQSRRSDPSSRFTDSSTRSFSRRQHELRFEAADDREVAV